MKWKFYLKIDEENVYDIGEHSDMERLIVDSAIIARCKRGIFQRIFNASVGVVCIAPAFP